MSPGKILFQAGEEFLPVRFFASALLAADWCLCVFVFVASRNSIETDERIGVSNLPKVVLSTGKRNGRDSNPRPFES